MMSIEDYWAYKCPFCKTSHSLKIYTQYDQNKHAEQTVKLNDKLRKYGFGGKIYITNAFHNLPHDLRLKLLNAIKTFNNFNKENDPHGQHDFAIVEVDDIKVFFKIDYHDKTDINFGSEDPSNPEITQRIMTIGLMSDY